MQRLRPIVVKNALSNVVRGGASSLVALALPHFLTRTLTVDRYSAWVLMLQIAAYANYLDFGLQTAVARYLAQAVERGDHKRESQVVTTALYMLAVAGLMALAVASVVVFQLPRLFPHAPHALIGELRLGVFILSVCAALSLPLSVFTGILIGLHRNEFPALAIGTTRLMGAGGVLALLPFTHSLLWLACSIGGFNLLGSVTQLFMALQLMPNLRVVRENLVWGMMKELLSYCLGLTVFSFAMLLVSGLDVTIVGYFAFAAAGYYGIAATIIGFVTGLCGAMFSALLAPMAVLQERNETSRIRDIVLSSTRMGSYVSLAIIVVVCLAGKEMLALWVGFDYARQAFPILILLLCAQTIRLMASGYSTALVATAQQKHGIAGALAEGTTNLVASIICAYFWGPIGVAWGTVVGAVCGISWVVLYTMGRTRELGVHRAQFTIEGALRPTACFAPLLLYLALRSHFEISAIYLPIPALFTLLLLVRVGRIRLGKEPLPLPTI
jgi:O-antigen/teichoic acid export membrane protein